MKDGYEMHTSEKIRNLGKEPRPVKRIVGLRVTLLCLALSAGVYTFVKGQSTPPEATPPTSIASIWAQQSPVLLVIAGALLLLCILLAVLIKTLKNKK